MFVIQTLVDHAKFRTVNLARQRAAVTASDQEQAKETRTALDLWARCEITPKLLEIPIARCGSRGQSGNAAAARAGNEMAKRGLYANINARKKAGTSRSKSKSTITPKAYSAMKRGFKK